MHAIYKLRLLILNLLIRVGQIFYFKIKYLFRIQNKYLYFVFSIWQDGKTYFVFSFWQLWRVFYFVLYFISRKILFSKLFCLDRLNLMRNITFRQSILLAQKKPQIWEQLECPSSLRSLHRIVHASCFYPGKLYINEPSV
jgi:hypothetical protein